MERQEGSNHLQIIITTDAGRGSDATSRTAARRARKTRTPVRTTRTGTFGGSEGMSRSAAVFLEDATTFWRLRRVQSTEERFERLEELEDL